jgi:RNA polymerase sigma factor (sigma-70 family)
MPPTQVLPTSTPGDSSKVPSRGLGAEEVSDVVHRYGALLERRCRILLRDPSHAEDALQELCATLLRRGEGLRDAQSKYRWLCRAADRTCLDLLRRGRHVRRAVPLDEIDPVGAAPGADPEARWAAVEMLGELSEEEQSLAIMLFVDGMSQGEAADELGVSRVTINKRAQRIRERLRTEEAAAS